MKDYYQLIPDDDQYYTLMPGKAGQYRLMSGLSPDFDLKPTDETHYTLAPVCAQAFSLIDTLKSLIQSGFSQKGVYFLWITELCRKLQGVMNLWIS